MGIYSWGSVGSTQKATRNQVVMAMDDTHIFRDVGCSRLQPPGRARYAVTMRGYTILRQCSFLCGMILLTVLSPGCGPREDGELRGTNSPSATTGQPSTTPPLARDLVDVDCSVGEDRILNYSTTAEVSELMQCIRYGHVDKALALIAQGVDLEYRTSIRAHAFSWAVEAEDTTIVRALLERGVPLNPGPGGMPLLGIALDRGNRALVEMLLEAGADPTEDDGLSGSPLISSAAGTGDTVIARLLLDRGADVNADPHDEFSGGPPLVEAGSVAMIEFLLRRGGDINLPEWYHNESILWRVVCRSESRFDPGTDPVALAQLLIEQGADVEVRDAGSFGGRPDDGQTPLICAVRAGDMRMVEMLLQHGANADVLQGGRSLLEIAREEGNADVTVLVERALR